MARYQPGDVVSRRKGFLMHKGIALRDGRILHNTPFRGEHICSVDEFRAGQRLHATRLERDERHRALRAVDGDASRAYNLFTNNCEHTVNRATTGRATSPQLQAWVVGVGVGAVAFALTRHPAAAAAGYALGRSVLSRIRNSQAR